MNKPYVVTKIGRENLNARWFTSFTKEQAIQKLIMDGLATDEDWAGRAYDQMSADVERFDHELWLSNQIENKKIVLVRKDSDED